MHDIGENGVFALLFHGLTVGDMDADPVFHFGTLKSHLEGVR